MRYSPQPIEAYDRVIQGKTCGPSQSYFLKDDLEAWNLAFLSFDYAKRPVHTDHQFTVMVVKSLNTRVDTGAMDLLGRIPENLTIRSLLKAPAPQFIKVLQARNLYQKLPLYKAYGQPWLDTMGARSWLCATYVEEGEDAYADIESTATAEEILRSIAQRRP